MTSRARARRIVAAVLVCTASCSPGDRTSPSLTAPTPPTPTQPSPIAGPFVAGRSYSGTSGYVEYLAGNMPLIFSAPHGGLLTPTEITPRTDARCGGEATTARDLNTQELARDIQAAFFTRTGRYPHVVINLLHRDRLDANRPVGEAACGSAAAERAWTEYHAFLDTAHARVVADQGAGWYTDLHGHGHAVQRLELGYNLAASTLRKSNAELDADVASETLSSIAQFSRQDPASFSTALRGPAALGSLLARAGFPSVPSDADAAPATADSYFSGGYSTERHACVGGGPICGVQIESNFAGVRDTPGNRARFAAALVDAYTTYLGARGIPLSR